MLHGEHCIVSNAPVPVGIASLRGPLLPGVKRIETPRSTVECFKLTTPSSVQVVARDLSYSVCVVSFSCLCALTCYQHMLSSWLFVVFVAQ